MFHGESLPRRSESSSGFTASICLQVSQRGFGAQKGGLGIFVPFMLGCKHFWWAGGGTEIKFVAGQTGVVRAPRVGSCGDDEMDGWRNVETERRGGGGAGDGRRGGWGNGGMGDCIASIGWGMGKWGDGGGWGMRVARPLRLSA